MIDWNRVAYTFLASRRLDAIEETQLVPERKVLYQFSATGHELSQIVLGNMLTNPKDAVGAYYRSRPLLLSIGLTLEDAFAAPLMKSGGFSDGRDIGVVCNFPSKGGATVIPMSGDVGAQFTPIAGWAQALQYYQKVIKDKSAQGAIAVAHAGDAAVATNGFWSALTMATTLKLPMLFFIEDNSYGISVPSIFQTPGGNIAQNLASFKNLFIRDIDGTNPQEVQENLTLVVDHVRSWKSPALIRVVVPRLCGHSGQDTQTYKSKETIAEETSRDPLPKFKSYFCKQVGSEQDWKNLEAKVETDVQAALQGALSRPEPDKSKIYKFVFDESHKVEAGAYAPEPTRINMVTAIRRTLEHELKVNPKVLVFGEDVGPKGGVHAATMGLQDAFGGDRVFDTSLSEEGIIGRSVGMALAGLKPVPELQFRKYADPATEQLNNCGTIRWRTNNRFSAPIVVRIPGGYFKCGDPWHSVSNEVLWAHAVGWHVAIPSNAEDAVGLLRAALRGNNPTIFFESRAMLDSAWARRPYPGDEYVLPFGKAKIQREGDALTLVTWGAMTERCDEAITKVGKPVELIDLRTIQPWDKETVQESLKKTRRCLIVHEDGITAGFGAEIAAYLVEHSFFNLDAPILRCAVDDIPIPHNLGLMDEVVPNVSRIQQMITQILEV